MAGCPSCGEENPERAKFCLECGAPLAAAQEASAREERKVVSVLFCDLVGFTSASEMSDPEDVQRRLDPYHARVHAEIERFGGSVEKYIGDAVMAVFGIPAIHEDDAERAVRTGLAVLEAIDELNEADPGLELQVRIGVNTGEAIVAMTARPETGQWMVSGDVTNTASRLQSVAPAGSVVVGEQTHRVTERIFDYEPLEPVTVKGKAEPLSLWRANAARARLGSDVLRNQTTPFVGRDLEKPLLIGTFERASQASSVQLVTIVGEPGVGKSRLVGELGTYIDAKPDLITWRQGRCLPYGDGITFWALGEIVKAHAGIYESDSHEAAEAKLEVVLPHGEDRPWLRARLLPLLGIDSGLAASREESFTAWRRFLEAIASHGPAVVVVEDLHWGDPALLDFISHLAEWAEGVPLLLLCTARPELYERNPGWAGGMRNATTINLAPLSDAETAELISGLLAQTVLTADVEQAILERSGGNPLYAEEFVRLAADRSLENIGDGLAFPDSVQALIAARLDTLPAERKSLLQDAAVVGKVFWAGALAEMGGRPLGEVEQALHELSRKELVRPARSSSMEGEAEYSFWHLLVCDIAYAQIPRKERIRRHCTAAQWIERKAGERIEDLAELLAHHYLAALEQAQASGATEEAASLVVPARRFLTLAGERALGLDAVQAEARLARALDLCPPDDAERPALLLRWADAAVSIGRTGDAAVAAQDALAIFRERGEDEAAARALILLSDIAHRHGESRFLELAKDAVSLLEQTSQSSALVGAYAQLTRVTFLAGAHHEAIAAAERALALAERLGLPQPARALAFRGAARADLGQEDGLREMHRAMELYIKQGASRDAAGTMNNLALARLALEGPGVTLAAIEEAVEFARRVGLGDAAYLESNCAALLVELGRTREALEMAGRLASSEAASGQMVILIELWAVEVWVHSECGDTDAVDAERLVRTALETHSTDQIVLGLTAAASALQRSEPGRAAALLAQLEQTPGGLDTLYYARGLPAMVRSAIVAGDMALGKRLTERLRPLYPLHNHALCAARAQLAEAAGEKEQAASLYAEAVERWQGFGNVPERAYALLGQGRCLVFLGQSGAEESLAEARNLFESMGYRPSLAETETLLEEAVATPL